MSTYPDSVKLYAYLNSAWVEITADVMEQATGYWGLRSNREVDRVADTGRMTLTLNNDTGKYSPNLAGALAGWKKGAAIKMDVVFRGRSHIKFYGVVDSVKLTGGASGLRRAYVTVVDWMDYAAKYPLVNPGIQTSKRADEALTTIVNLMPIAPQATSFGTGDETFVNVFDSVTTRTKALTEFNKLAMSEMGYIYLRKERTSGEQLTFNERSHRKGTDSLTTYSVPSADAGFLLKEDGDYLLFEDGGKMIIERAEDLTLRPNNDMLDIGVEYGANVINRMTVVAYPRKTDTSAAVLFSLGYAQVIGAGETISLRGNYFDPTGGSIVNAVSNTMITPAATTDYLMNDASDGSGTDRTASLTVTATYGTEGVTYELTNGYSGTCYITKLQARGYGVYTYATLESTEEDQPSYDAYGYSSETIHMMYQQNTSLGKNESAKILDMERQPRTILNKITLSANRSPDFLYGYLVYDVGDLVRITEDQTGIDSYYYIQAVSFTVIPGAEGAIITYGWTLKEQRSVSGASATGIGLSLVAAEFSCSGSSQYITNQIDFGSKNYLNNIQQKSFSFWVYATDAIGGLVLNFGNGSSTFYNSILIQAAVGAGDGILSFHESDGLWIITQPIPQNTWHNFIITKSSTAINIAPVIYQNGVSATVSVTTAQTVIHDETNYLTTLGARPYNTTIDNAFAGKLKDARVYNTILTAAQALGIYNEGAGGAGYLSNLQFQAPCVRTEELDYYTDHTMLSTDRVIDNVYGEIGKPKKESTWTYPIIRLP